jgi:FkbM family methyltransferase
LSRNEEFVTNYISSLPISSGDRAMDIGANKGVYSSLLADKFDTVYAIEPHPNNIKDLMNVASENPNITVHQCVIGTHEGKHTLFTVSNPGGHSIMAELADSKKWGHTHAKSMEVDSVTLDSFSNMNIRFIKCDIEGGESEIFFHGEKLLSQTKPTIILETHQVNFEWKKLVDYFHKFGYTVYDDRGREVDDMKFDSHYLITMEREQNEVS